MVCILKVGICAVGLLLGTAAVEANPEAAKDVLASVDNLVLQKLKLASGDSELLEATLEKLIGSWHQSPDNFNDEAKAWMLENKVTDFYDTFSWGTNKAWIDFGDYRVVEGQEKKTGVGIISWHTGFNHLRFRESGASGGFVDGMLEIKDENTIVRHYEFFNPQGEVSYSSDTWVFDPEDLSCFIWQSTAYGTDGKPTEYPGRKFCKIEAE